MNKHAMARAFAHGAATIYEHLSKPLYVKKDGPYFVALVTDTSPWQIHLYEILDEVSFFTDPGSLPQVFTSGLFLYEALKSMNFPVDDALHEKLKLSPRKIVPDTPACRQVVEQLFQTHPRIASGIFLMTRAGALFSSQDLFKHPAAVH
jgi:hypothetical protein